MDSKNPWDELIAVPPKLSAYLKTANHSLDDNGVGRAGLQPLRGGLPIPCT